MKKLSAIRVSGLFMAAIMLMSLFSTSLTSCGNTKSGETTAKEVDDEAFYKTQPVVSGLYDANYYDMTGVNAKKGHFDGRIYFSLSPETSVAYVFENGNRTKIDYLVHLQKPFEKTDSGVFVSIDQKDRPVTITPDSANLVLGFQMSGEDIKITFNPKPRHTGTAVEILEKITAQKKKGK